MAISYTKLNKILERRGLSVNRLIEEGVITDTAGRRIRSGEHINTKHLESICLYLSVSVGDIIEFTKR